MALPQMRKRNPLSIFGSGAKNKEMRSPGFIDQRNQQLAGQFQQQGVKDMQGIEQNLMQKGSFSRANEADRKNTITNIYNLMQRGGSTGGPAIPPATASNPYRMVEMSSTGSDLNSLDLGGLEDELVKSRYKAMRGEGGADELVRINRIQRLIKEKSPGSAGSLNQSIPDASELERKRDEFMSTRTGQDSDALAKYRQQMEAQFANRRRDLEIAGQKERESAQGAMSTSGFGRSTVNAEMQGEIERRTQNAILAEQQAKDLAIMAYQRELEGATAEELAGYDGQIRQLQGQAEAIKMENAQRAMEMNQQSSGAYTEQLDSLMQAQAKSEAEKMKQETTPKVDWSNIKVQRIGGTNKNPIYGYFDPTTGEIKQASGGQMQAMGYTGGGVGGGGGSRAGVGGGSTPGTPNAEQQELVTRLQRINDAVNSSYLPRSAALLDPNLQADLDYIKANMTFEKISDMKKSGVKLGVLSDSDMKALAQSALSITPGMTKERVQQETNRLIAKLGGSQLIAPVNTPVAQKPIPKNTNQTTTKASTTTKSGVSKNKFKKLLK